MKPGDKPDDARTHGTDFAAMWSSDGVTRSLASTGSGLSTDLPFLFSAGQRFGAYVIVRPLGNGGMGQVYEAEETDSGRRVAIKILSRGLGDEEERVRFLREGQLAALAKALEPFRSAAITPASLGRRFMAGFIDTYASALPILPLNMFLNTRLIGLEGRVDAFLLAIPSMVSALLYYTVFEGRFGCGLGKAVLNLRVVDAAQGAPGYRRAFLRALLVGRVRSDGRASVARGNCDASTLVARPALGRRSRAGNRGCGQGWIAAGGCWD